MLLAIRQCTAYTYYKYGTVSLTNSILALLRRLVGIHLQQLVGMDEVNLLGQEGFDLRVGLTRQVFRATDGSIDALHHILQELQRAVLLVDDGLPVPLVHIQRVQVVQLLVGTDGVHVGIDAVARLHLVLRQRQTLPLRQRVNHLGTGVAQILDGERDGTLHPVQVVVDAQTLQHEQRRRHTAQTQLRGQVLLEKLLNQFNTLLRLLHVQQTGIFLRFNQLTHLRFFRFCVQR